MSPVPTPHCSRRTGALATVRTDRDTLCERDGSHHKQRDVGGGLESQTTKGLPAPEEGGRTGLGEVGAGSPDLNRGRDPPDSVALYRKRTRREWDTVGRKQRW